jgi:hypothetical protein
MTNSASGKPTAHRDDADLASTIDSFNAAVDVREARIEVALRRYGDTLADLIALGGKD